MAKTALISQHAGRVLLFLLLFTALTLLWSNAAGTAFQAWVIHHLTVVPAAWAIDLVDPARNVTAAGAQLAAPGGSVNVLAGCEGADLVFLLVSAMVCAPLSWRARGTGVLLGILVVFVLNQARVIGLLYALQHDRAVFDLLHGTLLPLVLVVLISGFFLWWLERGSTPNASAAPGRTT